MVNINLILSCLDFHPRSLKRVTLLYWTMEAYVSHQTAYNNKFFTDVYLQFQKLRNRQEIAWKKGLERKNDPEKSESDDNLR